MDQAIGYNDAHTIHFMTAHFAVFSLASVHNLLTFKTFDSSHKIDF